MAGQPRAIKPIAGTTRQTAAMLLLGLGLAACGAPEGPKTAATTGSGEDTDTAVDVVDTGEDVDTGGIDDTGPQPLELAFTFAIIADPHVTGATANLDRLDQAVDWLAAEAEPRDLELVFILGDIAWGGGYDLARESLERLPVPWVPVQGDNPIQVGEEAGFIAAFADQVSILGESRPGWRLAPSPVPNPERGGESHLHNFAFDHGPVRFVGLDWNSRELDPLWGEMPDLHDFAGGTLPFLREELDALEPGPAGQVVLLSHMPMYEGPGSFDLEEAAAVEAVLGRHPGAVAHNLCGHLHANAEHDWAGLLHVTVTDATFEDANTVRIVEVWASEEQVELRSEALDVR